MSPRARTARSSTSPRRRTGPALQVRGPPVARQEEVLTPEALDFLRDLHQEFEPRRRELLRQRGSFRALVETGQLPDFPRETASVRASDWRAAPPPPDLTDRRVEITGPTDRKMVINALNSGARVYMADFEDAHSPTWTGTLTGQVNLQDAVRRRITFTAPGGQEYRLGPTTATLMVRPRGWHLEERHVTVDRTPMSASLFDFGLYLFHNAAELRSRGTAPYFYLPKMEHYLEARLWNDVFIAAQERLGVPRGTVRATALIETLPAAFQMEEILYELRDHSAGLNCGRWDYLFSCIKQYRDVPSVCFPDRSALAMTTPFLRAYSRLLIQTCHRRGAHAMGGMAAQIPIKGDPAANDRALALVVADKEREAHDGHDGTWVAHPALVPVARGVFDRIMPGANQIDRPEPGPPVEAHELVEWPSGPITEEGVRRNARVSVRYLAAWLGGTGCVPIDHLMEDAATVEIARSQLWQWIHHGGRLADGSPVDPALVRRHLQSEGGRLLREGGPGDPPRVEVALELLDRAITERELEGFMPLVAYPRLEALAGPSGSPS
jgi:malate synthase